MEFLSALFDINLMHPSGLMCAGVARSLSVLQQKLIVRLNECNYTDISFCFKEVSEQEQPKKIRRLDVHLQTNSKMLDDFILKLPRDREGLRSPKSLKKWDTSQIYSNKVDFDVAKHLVVDENFVWTFSSTRVKSGRTFDCISSYLALYRLLCMGEVNVNTNLEQSSVWQVALKHEKSGRYLILMDLFGEFSVGSDDYTGTTKSSEFLSDMLIVLNELTYPQLRHAYGQIAGTQA